MGEIIGRVDDGENTSLHSIPLLGDMRKVVAGALKSNVDEIIPTQGAWSGCSRRREALRICCEVGLKISSLASVYEPTGRLPVDYASYDVDLLLSPPDSPSVRLLHCCEAQHGRCPVIGGPSWCWV